MIKRVLGLIFAVVLVAGLSACVNPSSIVAEVLDEVEKATEASEPAATEETSKPIELPQDADIVDDEAFEDGEGANSAVAGETVEKFGYRITIPAEATSHGMGEGTYDINFGEDADIEGFLCFTEPEAAPGMTADMIDSGDFMEYLDSYIESTTALLPNKENEMSEVRQVSGQEAYYYYTETDIMGISASYELYIMIGDEAVYGFFSMKFTDDITSQTSQAMDDVIANLEFIG
ncbi:MAG: hypothetical protein ACOYJB_08215 [Christensenellaceae bacterium]